jgi:hypothetical protein
MKYVRMRRNVKTRPLWRVREAGPPYNELRCKLSIFLPSRVLDRGFVARMNRSSPVGQQVVI